ncbi:MAG: ABC-F family ATP-binding cassette domain-containing protein [Bacteroidetes bacterium]|nr:ABC-F family ATP-binding cassette domain-containing protein [Bacteroidota bacterium]
MISLSNIHLQYSHQVIFDGVSAQFTPRDRVAIVGSNGKGKSTLMKMITGDVFPDKGEIHKAKGIEIGYLSQDFAQSPGDLSVIDEVLTAFHSVLSLEEDLRKAERLIEDYSRQNHPDLEDALAHYGNLQHKFEVGDGFTAKARAEEILGGLGFKSEDFHRPVSQFSGGWRMRIAITKLLCASPDYLLLDEPTNHLDLETLEWLENYLKSYEGALILISHDRYFLDQLAARVLEIEFGKITEYSGNYSFYEEEKVKREEILKAQYANQQAKLAQLNRFVERFRYKATKSRQVQSRIKLISKMDKVELGQKEKTIHFEFPEAPRSGRIVLEGKKLGKAFGENLLFSGVDFIMERGEKVALAGVNGSGKSTFVKMILGKEAPTGGELVIGSNVSVGYYAQHQVEELNLTASIYDEVLEASPPEFRVKVRTLLGSFLFEGDDVFKRIGVLSGGEKARVALAKLLVRAHNLIILDEPTNHLDMESKDLLIEALQDFDGNLLIISHDRYFLDQITSKVYFLDHQTIKPYLETYSDFYERVWKKRQAEVKSLQSPKTEKKDSALAAGFKSKEMKRQEAEERQKRHVLLKDVKKEFQALEKTISDREKQVRDLEADMASEGFMKKSTHDMMQASKKYDDLKASLEPLYQKWEKLAAQLEE